MTIWLDFGAKVVAILGGLFAAGLALSQARISLEQRRRDLRWKQAEMAKRVMDEWFEFNLSQCALQMTEMRKRRYATGGESAVIVFSAVQQALLGTMEDRERAIFIQDCFDSLFYFWDRTQQFLESGLVRIEDLRRPTEYYVKKMSTEKALYRDYAQLIGYTGALAFLDNFDDWRLAPAGSATMEVTT